MAERIGGPAPNSTTKEERVPELAEKAVEAATRSLFEADVYAGAPDDEGARIEAERTLRAAYPHLVAAAVKKLELAVQELGRGPNHSAFGQVTEDCALVHIDYFASVDSAAILVEEIIAEATGETVGEVGARLRGYHKCDCGARGCAGPEKAAEAENQYREHLLADLTPEFREAVVAAAVAEERERVRKTLEPAIRALSQWKSDPETDDEGRTELYGLIHAVQIRFVAIFEEGDRA